MSIGIVLEETMSGWIRLDGEPKERDFAFTIRAFTPKFFSLSVPREVRGVVRVAGHPVPCKGMLAIRLTGPRYELEFEHPERGPLHLQGEKTYSARPGNLTKSLVTCPLIVFARDEPIGSAEVAYRQSVLAFPFRAIRVVRAEQAFGEFGAECHL